MLNVLLRAILILLSVYIFFNKENVFYSNTFIFFFCFVYSIGMNVKKVENTLF